MTKIFETMNPVLFFMEVEIMIASIQKYAIIIKLLSNTKTLQYFCFKFEKTEFVDSYVIGFSK